MAKITPQIIFKKEKFFYWVDSHIDGTVVLPGIDLSTIESIEIDHTVFYGISQDKAKDMEGFYSSKKTKVSTYEIPLMSLTFSIPMEYPNLRKSQGFAFDGNYSLIQNLFTVKVKEKSFFTLSDSEKVIVPIDWPMLDNPDIALKPLNVNDEEDATDDSEKVTSLDELFPDSVLLPWQIFDRVSKEYYNSILASSWIARLWDMSYRNTSFKVLRYIAYIFLIGWIIFAQLWWFIWMYLLGGSFLAWIYLFLQYLPKLYLKRKADIHKYLPKIQKISTIKEKMLTTQNLRISDIFLPYQEWYQNPVSGISGELIVRMDLNHVYQYQEWKHTNTHFQMLVSGIVFKLPFNTIGSVLSDKNIEFPQWTKDILNMKDSYLVWLKKSMSISIMYDTLPDVDFDIEL